MSAQELTVLDHARAEIVGMRANFESLLGGTVAVERFERAVLTAISFNPALLELPKETLMDACRKAASDRLLPDGREGAIVPRWDDKMRKNVAAWQPMVRGIVKVAKLYAGVQAVICELVYEGEVCRVEMGDEMKIVHTRDPFKVIPDKEVACYAIFVTGPLPHEREREFMTRAQIEAIRMRSPQGKVGKGPWATDWGEMARKTLIHRLAKKLATRDEAGDSILHQVVGRVEEEYDFGNKRPDPEPERAQTPAQGNGGKGPAAAFHAGAADRTAARDVDPQTGEILGDRRDERQGNGQAQQGAGRQEPSEQDRQQSARAAMNDHPDNSADPRFVPLAYLAEGKPDWAPWAVAMKAHLAASNTPAQVKNLNAVNAAALAICRDRNASAWGKWMDAAADRVGRIEDETNPPGPAGDSASFDQRAA